MIEKHKVPPYIDTWSGRKINLLDPDPDSINIDDIANSLSMQCRFTGHTSHFYSVAEHSVLVSELVDPEYALEGLLHDAAEAYLSDIASPLKQLLPEYYYIEDKFAKAIAEKFNIIYPYPNNIKKADNTALLHEANQLLVTKGKDWAYLYLNSLQDVELPRLACLNPEQARHRFLDRFFEIPNKISTRCD